MRRRNDSTGLRPNAGAWRPTAGRLSADDAPGRGALYAVEAQYNCEPEEFCRSDVQVAFPASMGYNWEKEQREER